jgi:PAS domain S-box-containing protein
LVAAIGVAALSQDIFGWDLGMDQWLVADWTAIAGFYPGRMSPLTAFCFITLGLAMVTSTRPDRVWWSQGLALFAAIAPLVSLASFTFGLGALYGVASYRAMAIHTAVLLLTLAAGVLWLDSGAGLTGLLRGEANVGKATRRILLAAIAIPIAVEWLRLAGQRRGLYDTQVGVALFVVFTIVLMSAVILYTGKSVEDVDAKRRDAESALRRANETLEVRVAEKTTEARQNLARAEESAEMFFHLFEFSPDAIIAVNTRGLIERANVRTEEVFGYTRDELIGQPVEILIPEFAAGHVGAGLELFGRRKDGREFPVDVMLSPTQSPQGRLVLGVVRDITARKLAEASLHATEEHLRAGQRMEAMGRLAGGVAHDFNNMMTVVSGYSDLLLARTPIDDPSYKALTEIKKAGERCSALTRHLLAFSRRQMLAPSLVDLNTIVADLCGMLPVLLGEDIHVVNVPGPGLWRVRADQAQLEQVIVNLAVNARDAMPRGGTLTIETANVELDDRNMAGRPEVAPGPFVRLTVRDSGHGMDEATKARVFEPFFTTKPVGEGTGLGLSTVYGVIKQSDGYIYVDSEPDRGATFQIFLPKIKVPVAAVATPPSAKGTGGRETLLLVEDESAVRLLLARVLESSGYRVIAAGDGPEALRICEQFAEPIHLMITDVVMPGMSGGELVEHISPLRPDTQVLLMSGYTRNVVLDRAIARPGTAFLQKPFTPDALLAKVREVLAAAPQ